MNKQPKPNEEYCNKIADGSWCSCSNCTPPSSPLEEKAFENFDVRISSFLSSYLVLDSVGRNNKAVTHENAMRLRKELFQDMHQFISEVIAETHQSERERIKDIIIGGKKISL